MSEPSQNAGAELDAFGSKLAEQGENNKKRIDADKAFLNKNMLDYYQNVKDGIKSCDKILESLKKLERMFVDNN